MANFRRRRPRTRDEQTWTTPRRGADPAVTDDDPPPPSFFGPAGTPFKTRQRAKPWLIVTRWGRWEYKRRYATRNARDAALAAMRRNRATWRCTVHAVDPCPPP